MLPCVELSRELRLAALRAFALHTFACSRVELSGELRGPPLHFTLYTFACSRVELFGELRGPSFAVAVA